MAKNKQLSENIVEVDGVPLRIELYRDIENIIHIFNNPNVMLYTHKYTKEELKLKKSNERLLRHLIKSGKFEKAIKNEVKKKI